ncbi:MAG TPA: TPM domain-containing protein [Polyangiaceae bacterium]|nr:TPM domain-containing protein [Polyangiaceae bacterium]
MSLFDANAKKRIEAAIAALETRTAAEVVVAVVPNSGRPWMARSLVALGCGLVAGWLLRVGMPLADPRAAPIVELVVMLGAFELFGLHALERLLIPRRLAEQEVRAHAFAIFGRRGLYRTRGRTGVLILLSELERRAVILGDEGIHGRIGDGGWQEHIDRIVSGIREGRAADGVVDVLGRLGEVLAEIAPPVGVNDDELPNTVLDET